MTSCVEFSFSFYVRTAHEDWFENLGEYDVFGRTLGTGIRAQLPGLRAGSSKVIEYASTRDVLLSLD